MKKKLRLQKEVVSVLDKKQMNYLTKGGGIQDTGWTSCCPNYTFDCPTDHDYLCESKICLEPKTEDGCGGETGQCASATGCATDVCPVSAMVCFSREDDCMVDPTVIC